MMKKREEDAYSAFYEESKQYFEDRYNGVEWSTHPKIDHESRSNEIGAMEAPLGIEQPQMNAVERAYKISRNEFFITVAALAISVYNEANDIKLSWIYNGREDTHAMNTVGLLFRDLPVAFRFKDSDVLRNVFADVHEQVGKGIEHCCYPYVEMNASQGLTAGELACVLYQRDIRDTDDMEAFGIHSMDIRQNQAAAENILDIQILDGSEGLQLAIDFAASRYEEASIERFRDIYVKLAQAMATHNSQSDVTIGELKKKIADKRGFFQSITGIFRKKR